MRPFQIKTTSPEQKAACYEKAKRMGFRIGPRSWENRGDFEGHRSWPWLIFSENRVAGYSVSNGHIVISPEDFLALGESK